MPAFFTIAHEAESMPRIAVYQKSFLRPSLGLVAWQICSPSRGGSCQIDVPSSYEVYLSWGDPDDPSRGCRTAPSGVDSFTAEFNVMPVTTDDRRQTVPSLVDVTSPSSNQNEIDITNMCGQWVWAHVTKQGYDVYMPEILTPGMTYMVDVRPTYYLAVVNEFLRQGDRLVEAEHSIAGVSILPGQTATVTGSRLTGFAIAVR